MPKVKHGNSDDPIQVEIKEKKPGGGDGDSDKGSRLNPDELIGAVMPKPDPDVPQPPDHYTNVPEDKFVTVNGRIVHWSGDCKIFYGGVGFGYEGSPLGDVATDVFVGYSAYRAGIQKGDVVIPLDVPDLRGEPGTTVRVGIIRGNLHFEMTLTREKICYSDNTTETNPSTIYFTPKSSP